MARDALNNIPVFWPYRASASARDPWHKCEGKVLTRKTGFAMAKY